MTRRILILGEQPPQAFLEAVERAGEGEIEVVLPPERSREAVRALLPEVDIVLADWAGELALLDEEAAAPGRVALIQQPGAGVDRVALRAWADLGVPVCNTPGANAASVAEWCIGAAIAALRSIPWADAQVRSGRWPNLAAERGARQLSGLRVGVLGMGSIGAQCARFAQGLGCPVTYWSRSRKPEADAEGHRFATLEETLRSSDVLFVTLPGSPETAGLLDAERLALLPRDAVLVNAARGGLVDESALLAAVDSGALWGAALDVFAEEPLKPGSAIAGHDRILLSPHVAGATGAARARLFEMVSENLSAALAGRPVRWVTNDADPLVRWRDLPA